MKVRFQRRWQGRFWEHSQPWRRLLRSLRQQLSTLHYRLRHATTSGGLPPRVMLRPSTAGAPALPHPAIVVVPAADAPAPDLSAQTESSWGLAGSPGAEQASFCWSAPSAPAGLPATHLESLLLAAAALDLPVLAAGWSTPATPGVAATPEIARPRQVPATAFQLLRLPAPAPPPERPIDQAQAQAVLGWRVPYITGELPDGAVPLSLPLARVSGPFWVASDTPPGRVLTFPVRPVDQVLAALPPCPGPRTVLFLLPFLAIGGAERLLFDLLASWDPAARALIVTLEPHTAALGQTVDRARQHSQHVYTLGDGLPRAAQLGALRHLIRRYQVETLVSWNGTVGFYDWAPALKAERPALRILSQVFNHRGGWIAHTSPALVSTIDCHLAVNRDIARALVEDWGVPQERIALIHHGVVVPDLPTAAERTARRLERRLALGLPLDRPVVGTFIRLHPQKRPQDVLALARALAPDGIHFLLVGGGPLDAAIDRELAARPLPNLTRLPLTPDPLPLYDALDLCLLTSAYEGLPVFLLDGLAREIPCVSTAVGEIPELLAGGGGVIAPPGDLSALARGISTLLEPARRAAAGRAGRRTVAERFALSRAVQQYKSAIFA